MKKLIVGTEVIPYSITYSLKAKRKRIVIAASGVKVVPQGSREEEAMEFIESKKRRYLSPETGCCNKRKQEKA